VQHSRTTLSKKAAGLALLVFMAMGVSARGEMPGEQEDWFVVKLMGQRAGWAVMRIQSQGEQITTETEMHVSVRRGASDLTIQVHEQFIETADGRPVLGRMITQLGGQQMISEVDFGPEQIEVTTRQMGMQNQRTINAPDEPWLPPYQAAQHLLQAMEKGQKQATVTTFDLSSLGLIETTVKFEGEEPVEVYGRTIPAIRIRTTISLLPDSVMIGHIDAEGRPVRMSMDLGFMELALERADEELAKAEVDAPEMLLRTLVRPDVTILQPRQLRTARFRLTTTDGDRMPTLPQTTFQQVKYPDPQTAVVEVNLDPTDDADSTAAPQVIHSAMADGKDPKIRELTEHALKDFEGYTAGKVEALRRFVFDYVETKNLDVGLASAGEVARTAVGDCTEHAVLLAALLRAADIPSRAVSGLVYVDQFVGNSHVFGYHMWTQAWVDGRWVDVDATLGPATAFDATHITLSVSDLENELMTNDVIAMIPLIGRLSIDVLP
jgi:transglutaminase-like putative cysteine protease